jgi:hypothetical protein|tara:strand:+ start:172 stop:471 length:300 start_codon:yes stop_codon:yes gene_type:complete
MPTYTFKNKETGEVKDHFMSLSKRESFIENNPNLEQIVTSGVPIGDPVRMGLKTTDDGFKEVLSKIHENAGYGSTLGQKLSRAKSGVRNAIPTVRHKQI